MTSKFFFFLLIGCTLALGFPVDQANKDEKVAFQSDGMIANIIKILFGKDPEMISESIKVPLQNAFKEISKRLNTEEYMKVITELQNTLQIIYLNNEKMPNVAEQDNKAMNQAIKTIAATLGKPKDNVDTSKFIEAVHNFKRLVDKIYVNQGTN